MSSPQFISLDGLDGTGKSTQIRLLADWLRGQGTPVTTCADPGGTPLGDQIRSLLLDHRQEFNLQCEAFLFMASRSLLTDQIIRPALARGETVLCDRYLLANVVYQGHAGGLDPASLWAMGDVATGGLMPDLIIVLDLPVEQALARRGRPADRMERRNRAYHDRVRQGFLHEASQRPDSMRVVDATGSVEQVQASIRDEIARFPGT